MIFISFVIFYSCFASLYINAQSATRSYNSTLQRYEYFDSRRNLIGYETWNIVSKQWEYYDVKPATNNSYTPSPYVSPYNLDLIKDAMIYKQAQTEQLLANINIIMARIGAIIQVKYEANYISTDERIKYLLAFDKEIDKINAKKEINLYEVVAWLLSVEAEIKSWDKPTSSQSQQSTNYSQSQPQNYYNNVKDKEKVYPPGIYEVFEGGRILLEDNVEAREIGKTTKGTVKIISKARGSYYKVELQGGQTGYISSAFINLK